MATKTKKPTKKAMPAGPKPLKRGGRQETDRQVAPVVRQTDETTLEPLPIDTMRTITIAGRDFVALQHINTSPQLWTWQFKDGSLAWHCFKTRRDLIRECGSIPRAKPVRVRIVKS